ncbi:Histone-like DNA-binding regulator lsr2 [metagenome]|uniref:Histone-like DNA-binding regulator lsr2 n=1 Tax=metagenome TaxID=256318 RepID=A0A2P2BXH4_9ZZZZ
MAQKVHIVLVDDIDGSDADETVAFGVDGASYEIDLSSEHAAALRDALATYVGHARKVGGRRAARKASSTGGGVSAAEIREWARANGHDVPERGRVSGDVRAAYEAAN